MKITNRSRFGKYIMTGLFTALSLFPTGCITHPTRAERREHRHELRQHRLDHWTIDPYHYKEHFGVFPWNDHLYHKRCGCYRSYGTEHFHQGGHR